MQKVRGFIVSYSGFRNGENNYDIGMCAFTLSGNIFSTVYPSISQIEDIANKDQKIPFDKIIVNNIHRATKKEIEIFTSIKQD